MTDIGGNMSGVEQGLRGESAQPVRGQMPRVPEGNTSANMPGADVRRRHGVWESITASLELACRGYLCMQIVDCDPVSDPDCGASGKKVVMREAAGRELAVGDHSTASGAHASGSDAFGPVNKA